MKKVLRKIPIFLSVFALALTCFISPAFASDYSTVFYQPNYVSEGYRAVVERNDSLAIRSSSPVVVYLSQYDLTSGMLDYLEDNWDPYATFASLTGTFKVTDAYDDSLYPLNGYLSPMFMNIDLDGSRETFAIDPVAFNTFEGFKATFEGDGIENFFDVLRGFINQGAVVTVSFQSLSPNPGFYVLTDTPPLYSSAWDLLVKFIYGEGVELTPEQSLTLTLVSTFIVLAVVILPIAIIWIIISKVFAWW